MFSGMNKRDLENFVRMKDFLDQENVSMDFIRKLSEAKFSTKDLQHIKVMLDIIAIKEIDIDSALKEINEKLSQIAVAFRGAEAYMTEPPEPLPVEKCPKCKDGILEPVSGDNKGGETIFVCRSCRYSRYDGRGIEEVIKELRGKNDSDKLPGE